MSVKYKMKNDKQILIIEPDRLVGLDLQLQLEKKGFSAIRPISLVDTEVILSKNKPDLIIADTSIKKQNIFSRVKKYLIKYQLPFIWIGALKNKKAEKKRGGINVIGVFSKPFDGSKIVALIVSYFNKKIAPLFRTRKV